MDVREQLKKVAGRELIIIRRHREIYGFGVYFSGEQQDVGFCCILLRRTYARGLIH